MDKLQHKAQLAGYRADLVTLETKLAQLDVEREEIRNQIAHVKNIVANLSALAGEGFEPNISALGFTDACRVVLRDVFPAEFNAMELREELQKRGFDLSTYSNPLASIHTTLRRLDEAGEVIRKEEGLKTTYQWKGGRRRLGHRLSERIMLSSLLAAPRIDTWESAPPIVPRKT